MIRRQVLGLLSAALLAGPLLVACGSENTDADNDHLLRVSAIGFLGHTDPHQASTGPEQMLAGEVYLGLLTVNASGQIVPGLAESWWVSEDGLSYIFRLRPAQWPDGTPLTPNDVVRSFRRMLSPGIKHPLAEWLAKIRNGEAVLQGKMRASELGVRALTDTVVEISLVEPRPAFLALLAEPSVTIVREVRSQGKTALQGLGPYQIESQSDQQVMLVARQNPLSPEQPGFNRIAFTAIIDPLEGVQRFRNGEADVVTGASIGGISEAKTLPSPAITRYDAVMGVYGYVAQTRHGPLADVRLRRALAMTIDRQELAKKMFGLPGITPVDGLVPHGFVSYGDPALPGWAAWPLEQRQTEARRLVAEAGYGPDKPLRISVLLPPPPEHVKILQAIADTWRGLGVEVSAEIAQSRDYLETAERGAFDLALRPVFSSLDQPQVFLAPFTCKSPDNLGGFCVPEADQLLADAGRSEALATRIGLTKEAEQLMVEEAPLVPLFTPVRWSLVREDVNGWVNNPLGRHPFSSLTLQPAK